MRGAASTPEAIQAARRAAAPHSGPSERSQLAAPSPRAGWRSVWQQASALPSRARSIAQEAAAL
jgi:hypothetical protein